MTHRSGCATCFDILWQVVTHDLPPLIAELEKIL